MFLCFNLIKVNNESGSRLIDGLRQEKPFLLKLAQVWFSQLRR
jgi:hypothetical protein